MSVSFSKNKDALMQAWRDVLDNDNKTDWALFGYESQSFDLKVTGTGDGGLEEMIEDLNSGKIMYAFCRVMDPKTSLPKFVLINWQGEGAPGERKGKCANHFMDIANFFHGAHVTVHARTEDDVDPSVIIGMVSKATGSAYSFKERADPLQNHGPVGSVYKRTNPAVEINPSERHKFWERQETEEKSRIEGDRRRAVEMQQQLEKERQEREAKDAQRREQMVAERVKSINHLRQLNDQSSVNTASVEVTKIKAEVKKNDSDGLNRQQSGKQASVDRRLEAQNLIGQRTTNARTIFEQHTSVGQMSRFSNINKAVQEVSVRDAENRSLTSTDSLVTHLDTQSRLSREASLEAANDDYNSSNGANNAVKSLEGSQYHPFTETAQERNPVLEEDQLHLDKPSTGSTSEELKNYADSYLQAEEPYVGGQGLMARALYDYQAADDTEISFNPDDIITNIDQIDEGWWQGLAPDGVYGLFPANYVQVIDNLND